jgi:hypothetical protein
MVERGRCWSVREERLDVGLGVSDTHLSGAI